MDLDADLRKAKALFKKEAKLFKKIFKRDYKLIDYYGAKDPDTVFVSFGSLVGTIKDTVDSLIAQKKKVGVCNIICYRPFPDEEVVKVLSKVKNIIVMEKDVSLGSGGALYGDLKRALYGNSKAKIFGNVVGLGGRDIRVEDIQKIYKKIKK